MSEQQANNLLMNAEIGDIFSDLTGRDVECFRRAWFSGACTWINVDGYWSGSDRRYRVTVVE